MKTSHCIQMVAKESQGIGWMKELDHDDPMCFFFFGFDIFFRNKNLNPLKRLVIF